MTWELHRHDARNISTLLAPESVDLIITSPPYFALRSYQDGGEHYDGQLGSEPTPGEFVDALIECTRDWMRVLKPSGSLWVNLSDKHEGSGGYNNSNIGAAGRGPASYTKAKRGNSKDGAAATWTVATATWLAGVIDCDGSISARYFMTTGSPSVVPWVRVGMMDAEVVMRCAEITGVGRVFRDKRDVWNWQVTSQAAAYVLERIWPYLLIKQRQALAAIDICQHITECGATGNRTITPAEASYRRAAVAAIHAWNRREDHTFPLSDRKPLTLPHVPIGAKPKSRIGLPWRYALRCIDELGLILRADVIWSKPNGLPESVTDRVRMSHEYWFHFTREGRYFAAIDEVREEQTGGVITSAGADRHVGGGTVLDSGAFSKDGGFNDYRKANGVAYNPLGKVPGSVWSVPSEPLTVPDTLGVDHFAAFPSEWPRRIILGWSPVAWCEGCGEPRRPVTKTERIHSTPRASGSAAGKGGHDANERGMNAPGDTRPTTVATITGYACACSPDINGWPTAPTRPAVVLDPFAGTGTVPAVAHLLGRHGIGTDLSADYLRLAEWRCTSDDRLRDKVLDRSGIPNPDPPAIPGQLDLFADPC